MPRVPDIHAVQGEIMKKIFAGDIGPGERFVESRLAQELGVSRIPVRESIARLVAQGVLESGGSRQGAWMRRYSPEEVCHLYEFREAIEGQAARLAAMRAEEVDLQQLEYLIGELNKVAPDDVTADERRSGLDWQFHRAIIRASKNTRFINSFEAVLLESHYVLNRHPAYATWLKTRESDTLAHFRDVRVEHERIFNAIAQKNPGDAETFAREHVRTACKYANYVLIRGSDPQPQLTGRRRPRKRRPAASTG